MRIAALVSRYEPGASMIPAEASPYRPELYLPDHEVQCFEIHWGQEQAQVQAIARQDFQLFLNLCDGVPDEQVAGLEVVQALEALGLPFIGTSSRLFALTKAQLKADQVRLGIPTPAYCFVSSEAELTQALTLAFPLIVKHPDGYASVGMTRASKVETPDALRSQVRAMLELAGGALVESFVEGDEYTVLVAENLEDPQAPLVYPPVRCAFPPGETFKHFALKWTDYEGLTWHPCTDPALEQHLKALTGRMFVGIGGEAYARADFRVGQDGQPLMLELNTTCGIFYGPGQEGSADTILRSVPDGHRQFLAGLIAGAFRKHAPL